MSRGEHELGRPAPGRRGPLRFRPKVGASLASLVSLVILILLGNWQVQRLHWKTDLIDGAKQAVAAAPVDLPAVLDEPLNFDFKHVALVGQLIHDKTLYLSSRTHNGAVGRHAVTPLVRRDGGGVVLVDRGWVPNDWRAPVAPGAADETVEGIARVFPTPGRFTPDNDTAGNVWFIISRQEMAGALDLGSVAAVFVSITPSSDPSVLPIGEVPGLNLRNNHLGYAITWYGLAFALLLVYGAYSVRRDEE